MAKLGATIGMRLVDHWLRNFEAIREYLKKRGIPDPSDADVVRFMIETTVAALGPNANSAT